MRRRRLSKRNLEKLQRQARQLKQQMAVFKRSAQDIQGVLDQIVPEYEVEGLATARADLLGTLECLLNEDLRDADRHLGEIEELLAGDHREAGLRLDSRVGRKTEDVGLFNASERGRRSPVNS
jgi:hypothetical protein